MSTWLTSQRDVLVDVARTAKLADICQAGRLTANHDRLEGLLREHGGARRPLDLEYAAAAVRQGETEALIDFKAAPKTACENLASKDFSVAANYPSARGPSSTTSGARPAPPDDQR